MHHDKININGFTLVEILIVMAIMAIILGFGIPSYSIYQVRAIRTATMSELLTCAAKAEQIASINFDYLNIDKDTDNIPDNNICSKNTPKDGEPAYKIVIEELSTSSFRIAAMPLDSGRMQGTGRLTIDSKGARGWDKNVDGVIESEPELDEYSWQE